MNQSGSLFILATNPFGKEPVKVVQDVPGKMWHADLDDGSTITMRINHPTPDHAPAVMISVRKSNDNAGIKTQKIHFIKKGDTKWKI